MIGTHPRGPLIRHARPLRGAAPKIWGARIAVKDGRRTHMPHRTIPNGPAPCVLALMIHPGHSGYAALDGFGERAFGATQLSRVPAERASILVRLLGRLARRTRPTRIVLGVPRAADPFAASLREEARRACRRLHLDVVVRPLARALERLGAAGRPQGRNGLARHLTERFFPGLFHKFTARLGRLWKRRPAWHALALALSELVEVAPLSAAALAPAAGHRVPSFRNALRHALPAV